MIADSSRSLSARLKATLACALALFAAACATTGPGGVPETEFADIETRLARHISVLASEEFGGRRPGTEGERLTLDYIQSVLEASGFESGTNDPGNPWRVPVPLVSSLPVSGKVEVVQGRRRTVFSDEDALAFTNWQRSLVNGAEMLFVGLLGDEVEEPLVRGKVIVMLAHPGESPARRDALFAKGAAAVITIVENREAIAELRETRRSERLELESYDVDELSVFATEQSIAGALGQDRWAALRGRTDKVDFQPIALDATAVIEAVSQRRDVLSSNLIGRLPGAVPGSGAVLLLAHWDHFGECGEEGELDRLCNGAADNASGVAVMLELGRRLADSGPHDRDIYVLATTAEERGLLGAQFFAENPPIPLDEIVAAFNFDTVAIAPVGSAVGFVGEGRTPLDSVIQAAVAKAGRKFGSPIIAEQFLRRQDGWALLQRDVPVVVLSSAFGNEDALNRFLAERYHQASDEFEGIELGGAVEDLVLHQILIEELASTALYQPTGE